MANPLNLKNSTFSSTADRVVRQIETMILEGALRPGTKLPSERELAKSFDISRPTLRDALKILEDRSLLDSERGGGTYVSRLLGNGFGAPMVRLIKTFPETAVDYLEFREEIEGKAAALAAVRATEPDRKLIEHTFNQMVDAHERGNEQEEAAFDADFHLAIIEAAHNVMILHILQGLLELLREGVFYNRNILFRRRGVRDLFLEQHRAIYDGVMSNDPAAARQAVVDHLGYVRHALQDMARQDVWEASAQHRLGSLSHSKSRRPRTNDGQD